MYVLIGEPYYTDRLFDRCNTVKLIIYLGKTLNWNKTCERVVVIPRFPVLDVIVSGDGCDLNLRSNTLVFTINRAII